MFFITQIFMGFQTLAQCSADDPCLKLNMMSLLGIEPSDSGSVIQQGGQPKQEGKPCNHGHLEVWEHVFPQ